MTHRYAMLDGATVTNIIVSDADFAATVGAVLCPSGNIGDLYDGNTFITPEPPAPPPAVTDWLIDIGPFFDRFGAAKMPLLMSTNATVQALVKDLQVRKWIDLQRPDVGQGIDALISLGVPGMTAELKASILMSPATAEENFALRTVYFS